MKYVALLRGINVAGKNPVPMKELAALFEKAGAGDVVTYIQSGNVVFTATEALARKLPSWMAKQIPATFGCKSPVIVRSHDELQEIASHNRFSHDDPTRLLVMFLDSTPKNVAKLDAKRSPPDQFAVVGQDVYLFCPNGYGRSKLTNDYFDRTLGVVSTVRNWRTVLKLLEMTRLS